MNILNGLSISWMMDVITGASLLSDILIYDLLSYSFHLFSTMSSMNASAINSLFSGLVETLKNIVLVFVLFRMTFSIIQFILDPDKISESNKSGTKIVTDVLITFILLLSSSFIFGLLDDLQLLMVGSGSTERALNLTGNPAPKSGMITHLLFGGLDTESFGHKISCEVFSIFLHEKSGDKILHWSESGKPLSDIYDNNAPFTTLYLSNHTITMFGIVPSSIHYYPLISFIAALYFLFMFVKITINVVVRTFKLVALQIISPIAFSSYMVPGNKTLFNRYVSMYFRIYIELFSTIIGVYLGVILIKAGIGIGTSTSLFPAGLSSITLLYLKLFIFIAAFQFMKIFPQMISQLFGKEFKEEKNGFGKFFGGIVGAGLGVGTGLLTGKAAGLTGKGLAWNALRSGYAGMSSGSSSPNAGEFIKGQVANVSSSAGNAQKSAQNSAGLRGGFDSLTGRDQTIQRQGQVVDKAEQLKQNLDQVMEKEFVKQHGSLQDVIYDTRQQDPSISTQDIIDGYAYKKESWQIGVLSNHTNQSVNEAVNSYNDFAGSRENASYGFATINNYTDYSTSDQNLKDARKNAKKQVYKKPKK